MKDKDINGIEEKIFDKEVEKDNDDWEPTEVEQLSDCISYCVAEMVANRFQAAVKGMDQRAINALVRAIEAGSRAYGSVPLLKMFFLIAGDKLMAEVIDLVGVCAEYDDCAYDMFYDYLIETDIMDWNVIESIFEEKCGDEYTPKEYPFEGGN